MKNRFFLLLAVTAALFTACSESNGGDSDDSNTGVFVVCEGSFNGSNASLSYYSPKARTVENSVFYRANALPLGDVAQSMEVIDGKGFVVVNNSGVMYAIDPATRRMTGKIENLTSPRYACRISDTKAYLSDIYSGEITVFNPQTCAIESTISLGTHSTSEQMVYANGYVFVACWSTDNTVLVIDPSNDTVVREIRVGIQPYSMTADKNGKLWCLCDGGGWSGNPAGYEAPSLCRINTSTFTVERTWTFTKGDYFSTRLAMSPDRATLYYSFNKSLWKMSVTADALPTVPFIRDTDKYSSPTFSGYYSLGVDPLNGDIYLSDSADYISNGSVQRFDVAGTLLDTFEVGICPSWFCFKTK